MLRELARATVTKSLTLGGLHNRYLFFYGSGDLKSKIKVLTVWFLLRGQVPDLSPWLIMAIFSLHLSTSSMVISTSKFARFCKDTVILDQDPCQ